MDGTETVRRTALASPRGTTPNPRVVVVTGATGGVGRAVAGLFARRGDRVALLARGEAGLVGAAAEVEKVGGEALSIPLDVAEPVAVESAADIVERELGPIDVWINAAATSVFAPFMEMGADEFRRVTDVTYLGCVNGTRAALRRMLRRDRGSIVQVGSVLAYRGIPLESAYSAASHAVQGFHESVRCELLHYGSRVNATMVALPARNTPQLDWVVSRLPRRAQLALPRLSTETAARAIAYAADHPRRRERWVGGWTVATLIANAVAPAALDRYLARTGFRSQECDAVGDPGRPANLWHPADLRRPVDHESSASHRRRTSRIEMTHSPMYAPRS